MMQKHGQSEPMCQARESFEPLNFIVLTVDVLTGNDTITQAEEFHKTVSINGTILTKVDADVKGGSALSVTYVTSKPIMFIGTGQRYEDLQEFNAEQFTQMILK